MKEKGELVPYWVIAEKPGLEYSLWHGFARIWQGDGDLGERFARVYEELKRRHDFVIFIGADSPLLMPRHLWESYSLLAAPSALIDNLFVLGRARDGGFYLFGGGSEISKDVWTSVEYSSADTAKQLKELLRLLGTTRELEELPDVDTLGDLMSLPDDPGAQAKLLEPQKDLLRWIRQIEK